MPYLFYASILNERDFIIIYNVMEHNNSGVLIHNLLSDHAVKNGRASPVAV